MATEQPSIEPTKPQTMKAHCPRCDGERTCDVHGSFDQPWEWSDGEHSENGQLDHRLLQCRGCELVFYWQSSWDTQSWDYRYNPTTGEEETVPEYTLQTYPAPEKKSTRPDWAWTLYKTDSTLAQIMDEVYTTSEGRSFILASIGLRTALDRATEMLGIDPALPMAEKVTALHDGGWIGETEAQTLGIVAEAGNAAAHRAFSPDGDDFQHLLSTLEQFISRAILSGKRALEIGPKIPPKQARSSSKANRT
ncbi:DUF4145 domain-containing protein [Sphingosinicella sp. YJ22]|uniref:DUF4145 domain-containing protein n=1 Tax=Sphingosinicella sp. YJ22 TaxID=1104780 RepID=UPI00140882C6|nr:DUF4145 domain-containing protein [Sphingosinicella sp. YJ22]